MISARSFTLVTDAEWLRAGGPIAESEHRVLEIGLLAGAPLRPEHVEELMHQMNQPKLAHTLPDQSDEGDDPPEVGADST